jgi:hypothetical protein
MEEQIGIKGWKLRNRLESKDGERRMKSGKYATIFQRTSSPATPGSASSSEIPRLDRPSGGSLIESVSVDAAIPRISP